MHRIRFVKEALFDVEDVVIWYEKQRIGLSYDFELCLEAGLDEISRNPNAFKKNIKTFKLGLFQDFLMEFTIDLKKMKLSL